MFGSQQGNANCVFIRGATTCENTAEDIGNAACELVNEIFNANVVSLPMVSAMFFTVICFLPMIFLRFGYCPALSS